MRGAPAANLVGEDDGNLVLVDEVGKRRQVFMASTRSSVERYERGGLLEVANDLVPLVR